MSHTRGAISQVRWCPWCGLDRLKRDSYRMFRADKVEFVCESCGAAFRLLESTRKQDANRLMALQRKQRVPTPTDPQKAEKIAADQRAAADRRKFRELKSKRWKEMQRSIGEEMRQWIANGRRDFEDHILSETPKGRPGKCHRLPTP